MNNGSNYNYKRGAWLMKHPPPEKKIQAIGNKRKIKESNNAVFWTKVYVGLFIINIPPPFRHTRVNKTRKIYERTQGRSGTTD